jgi:hypothetical protein
MALWQQIGNTRTENGPIQPTTPSMKIGADLRFRRIPIMPNHRPLALRRREREFESRRGRHPKHRADQRKRSQGHSRAEGSYGARPHRGRKIPKSGSFQDRTQPTRVARHLRARTSADGCSGDTSASTDDLAASIASATTSSRSGNRCPYWSSVIVADLWPITLLHHLDIRTGCDRQRGGRVTSDLRRTGTLGGRAQALSALKGLRAAIFHQSS